MTKQPLIGVVAALFYAIFLGGCSSDSRTNSTENGPDGSLDDNGSTTPPGSGPIAEAVPPRNLVVITLDDYGVVSSSAYADQWPAERTAPTPTLEGLCERGVRFTQAWSNPTCSSTRAAMHTGRYGFRTGIGGPIVNTEIAGTQEAVELALSPDEVTVPRVMEQQGSEMRRAMFGKWHLGVHDLGGEEAPATLGWEHYAGFIIGGVPIETYPVEYFEWAHTVNGTTSIETGYGPSRIVDDAIGYVDSLGEDEPFLLWLAMPLPHTPFHAPPDELHSYTGLEDDPSNINNGNRLDHYEAMVEAGDHEIGRLLSHLDKNGDGLADDTLVIIAGDNGSQGAADSPMGAAAVPNTMPLPYSNRSDPYHGKGSLDEHGSRVPLCVDGQGVVAGGRDISSPVSLVDVFATVLDAQGIDASSLDDGVPRDSQSFWPLLQDPNAQPQRQYNFAEQFVVEGQGFTQLIEQGFRISDGSYALTLSVPPETDATPTARCFDMVNDPNENTNVLTSDNDAAAQTCESLRQTALDLVCATEGDSVWRSRGWCPSST